ncbi:unnamed protein product [Closterium sp. NIES-53]
MRPIFSRLKRLILLYLHATCHQWLQQEGSLCDCSLSLSSTLPFLDAGWWVGFCTSGDVPCTFTPRPQPSLSSHAPSAPRRLRYRSRQRGFLELDLLLGKWVEQHLPALDPPRLTALARLMDEESPDLFKWFTGQEQAPEHVVQNPVYLSIRSKVDERLHRMHPAVRAAPGLPWVRGWEDMQRQPGTPPAGNQ